MTFLLTKEKVQVPSLNAYKKQRNLWVLQHIMPKLLKITPGKFNSDIKCMTAIVRKLVIWQ